MKKKTVSFLLLIFTAFYWQFGTIQHDLVCMCNVQYQCSVCIKLCANLRPLADTNIYSLLPTFFIFCTVHQQLVASSKKPLICVYISHIVMLVIVGSYWIFMCVRLYEFVSVCTHTRSGWFKSDAAPCCTMQTIWTNEQNHMKPWFTSSNQFAQVRNSSLWFAQHILINSYWLEWPGEKQREARRRYSSIFFNIRRRI